jgi:hypothetical protein
VQDAAGGAPKPISTEGVRFRLRGCISPDGKLLAATNPEGVITIYSADGSQAPRAVPSSEAGEIPTKWTPDGKGLLVGKSETPSRVYLIDLASGKKTLFGTYGPADTTGLQALNPPLYSRDLKSYAYGYSRITSDLYIVDGLK